MCDKIINLTLTLVVETALECSESVSVNVYASDTNALVMLIYHQGRWNVGAEEG